MLNEKARYCHSFPEVPYTKTDLRSDEEEIEQKIEILENIQEEEAINN